MEWKTKTAFFLWHFQRETRRPISEKFFEMLYFFRKPLFEFSLASLSVKIHLEDTCYQFPRPDGGTVDAEDLKSSDRKIVRVRIPLRAPGSQSNLCCTAFGCAPNV